LFVTAFEETGRSAFARYKRSNDNYRASFRALAEALNVPITKDPLVAYDDILWMGLPANTVVACCRWPTSFISSKFVCGKWELPLLPNRQHQEGRRTPKSPAPPRPPGHAHPGPQCYHFSL
jgi:hypothetical protein